MHPNRVLRDAGYLGVKVDLGLEYLDPGTCRAFSVSDHQIAHIYVRDRGDLGKIKDFLSDVEGVAYVLDREAQGQSKWKIDHERSGDLVCVAAPGFWFAYHYWLEEARRPDFATTVDIHQKPGYDPTELFLDPKLSFPKLKIAWTLLRKRLGFRYLMDVIGTDPSLVRGSHGRLLEDPDAGPVFLCSSKEGAADSVDALEVRDRILKLVR